MNWIVKPIAISRAMCARQLKVLQRIEHLKHLTASKQSEHIRQIVRDIITR